MDLGCGLLGGNWGTEEWKYSTCYVSLNEVFYELIEVHLGGIRIRTGIGRRDLIVLNLHIFQPRISSDGQKMDKKLGMIFLGLFFALVSLVLTLIRGIQG